MEILNQIKQLIPPLNGKLHKGQSGRVGVLGGALECVLILNPSMKMLSSS
jgi:hypothetical protein